MVGEPGEPVAADDEDHPGVRLVGDARQGVEERLALAFVVAAGAVGVVGASRVGQTPGAVAAMLALYGAVALAEQAARSVLDRSHDIALARVNDPYFHAFRTRCIQWVYGEDVRRSAGA